MRSLQARAVRVYETGGPDVLTLEKITVPPPGKGEVLIRQSAAGLNFIDVYHRSGLYPLEPPFTPGMEAAGTIEEAGEGVEDFKPGDRVAYASPPLGAYAELRVMKAERVVKLPDGISDEQAAAVLVKGMTAEYLLHRTYPVRKGETILFHAAAGGVGLLACQWAKHLGATVIGTVGSAEKAELARAHGCDHVILYREEDIAARVREITGGEGAAVVYDSVGRATFEASLNSLRRRGMLVSFGNASGPVEPFAPNLLAAKGSLYLTRPSLMHYTEDTAEYRASARAVFDAVQSGAVKIEIGARYALENAAQAHKDLEARKTTGSGIFTLA